MYVYFGKENVNSHQQTTNTTHLPQNDKPAKIRKYFTPPIGGGGGGEADVNRKPVFTRSGKTGLGWVGFGRSGS